MASFIIALAFVSTCVLESLCQDTARSGAFSTNVVDFVNQTLSCPHGWVLYKGGKKCLWYSQYHYRWTRARNDCIGKGGNLITVPDKETDDFLQASDSTLVYWVGLNWADFSHGILQWVTGDYTTKAELEQWSKVYLGSTGQYVAARFLQSSTTFMGKSWWTSYKYICEKGVTTNIPKTETYCRQGWTFYPGADTCFMPISTRMDWTDSRKVCQNHDGDLARVSDGDTETFITETFFKREGDELTFDIYWIGLRELEGGRLMWRDDDDDDDVWYSQWHFLYTATEEEPSDGGSDLDYRVSEFGGDDGSGSTPSPTKEDPSSNLCVLVNTTQEKKTSYQSDWWLVSCRGNYFKAVCQRPLDSRLDFGVKSDRVMTSEEKVLTKDRQTCRESWIFYEKGVTCFRGFSNEFANWTRASEVCSEENAQLAKVDSFEVLGFLKASMDPSFYLIGLSDLDNNGVFEWDDGEIYDGKPYHTISFTRDGLMNGVVVVTMIWDFQEVELNLTAHFICQYNTTTRRRNETLRVITITGKEYYLSDEAVDNRIVSTACQAFGLFEFLPQSGREFAQLLNWLNKHTHVYNDTFWLKTRKTSIGTFHWNDASEVGVSGVWVDNEVGDCSRTTNDTDSHACCTVLHRRNTDTGYRLQEEICDDESRTARFICVEELPAPSVIPTVAAPPQPSPTQRATTTISPPFFVPVFVVNTNPPSSQPQTTTLPPLPPTEPLTTQEKQEFTENLNFLKTLTSSSPSSSPSPSSSSPSSSSFTTSSNSSTTQNKLCPCACAAFKFSGMPSPGVLANMVSKIQRALRVETHSLSSRQNKKTSANDPRPSCQSIAIVAVTFALVPIIVIVCLDLLRIYSYVKAKTKKQQSQKLVDERN